MPKCPETEWDQLEGQIAESSIGAMSYFFSEQSLEFCDNVDQFMKKYKLSLQHSSDEDPLEYSRLIKQTSIENGVLYEYKAEESDYADSAGVVRVYVFSGKVGYGGDIDIYFVDTKNRTFKRFGL